ncbi:putative porin [Pseudozobellia thermophila]|uniref:Putative porin n=1 Tax=Pseudozobellia thermophila TaxID=192903 RepID=A0A1M6NIU4_9FLAO|nr:putative porin [Pseudozobellia thermophila]SHJ95482.1 Putative porin [Pseudozobellia thermophila]
MKYFLLILLLNFFSIRLYSQEDPALPARELDTTETAGPRKGPGPRPMPADTTSKKITIEDYKIISYARDTTFLDTTLTIQKEYKYNFLRRDDFELMPFANVGQPYNKLGVDLRNPNFYPMIGARGLHFNYMELEDIKYYNVATPMSDLFFKTTFEQGQLLDASLAFNTSRRLNFSIAFKGFRSLGKYQYNQAESGQFRTTTNYVTANGRYSLRAHIAAQDMDIEANGGLVSEEEQFESKDPDFTNRVKIDVRFNDALNRILGKRYYFDHLYKLVKKDQDSSRMEKTSLGIGHQFNYETKYYSFNQTSANSYFGDAFQTSISDRANLKTMYNQVNAEFYNATLGRLQGNVSLYNYNYFFNSILIAEDGTVIPNKLKGEEVAIGAEYEKRIQGFDFRAKGKYNVSGRLGGSFLQASTAYLLNDRHKLRASGHVSEQMPNFNFLLNQSDYSNYNWLNLYTFDKEQVFGLNLGFESEVWGDLSLSYTTVGNYTYFGTNVEATAEDDGDTSIVMPLQESNVLNHTKVKYSKELKWGKFALNNTLMYQNVSQANQVLNVPELVTRNTLYFSSDVFKKAMFLQTGITLKYFTEYYMDGYNPLLGEFYLQNDEKLGGYPMLDFFINARIQQTRIYLKAEHFNSSFGKTSEFYSAPNYPYRDFVIRFGLVWNFFS